jgi:hypothetical protein
MFTRPRSTFEMLQKAGAASVAFLLIHLLKGKCTYDDILQVIGMSIGIATWSSMLHDLTDAFLSFIGVIDMKAYEKLLNEPTFLRFSRLHCSYLSDEL